MKAKLKLVIILIILTVLWLTSVAPCAAGLAWMG